MTAEPTLQRGDSGDWVTYLQQQLTIWDQADALVADGYFGEKTEAKLREFQGVNLGQATGVADDQTWSTLLAITQPAAEAEQLAADEATHVEQQDAGTHAATGEVKVHVNDSFDFDGKVLKVWIGGVEHAVAESSQGFDVQIFDKDGGEGYWMGVGLTWPHNDVAAGEWVEWEHSFETNAVPDAGEGYRYRVSINRGKGEALETTKEFAFDVGADGTITFH